MILWTPIVYYGERHWVVKRTVSYRYYQFAKRKDKSMVGRGYQDTNWPNAAHRAGQAWDIPYEYYLKR